MHALRLLPIALAACTQVSPLSSSSQLAPPVVLTIGNDCPTDITLDLQGATLGGQVTFFRAPGLGSSVIQSGPCAGRALPIGGVNRVVGTARTNPSGAIQGDFPAPNGVCGNALVAVDLTTCEVSNPEVLQGGPPTAPVASLDPASQACDPLVCQLSIPSSDPDGDTITYEAMWMVDNIPYNGPLDSTLYPGDTVPAGEAQPGSTWTCAFTASDGFNTTVGPDSNPVTPVNVPQVNEFVMPADRQAVDFLLVIDDSGSMSTYQSRLVNGFATLADTLLDVPADGRVGVITTDVDSPTRSGRLNEFQGFRFLTESTPDLANRLTGLANVGTQGSANEQGLDAIAAAVSRPLSNTFNAGFKRPNADLALVVLSDEDDFSILSASQFASTAVGGEMSLGIDIDMYGIITPPGQCVGSFPQVATRYISVISQIGGNTFPICASDYGPILERIAREAAGRPRTFDLGFTPDLTSLTVELTPRAGATIPLDPSDYVIDLQDQTITLVQAPPTGWTLTVTSVAACEITPPGDTGMPFDSPGDTF
jgi:hypothetical protein